MSIQLLDRNHIRFLVEAAMAMPVDPGRFFWYYGGMRQEMTFDNATEAGQMLWDANLASATARYPGRDIFALDLPEESNDFVYVHMPPPRGVLFDPVQVIKSIQHYRSNTQSDPGWETSPANAFTQRLLAETLHRLPGYGEATWGAPQIGLPDQRWVEAERNDATEADRRWPLNEVVRADGSRSEYLPLEGESYTYEELEVLIGGTVEVTSLTDGRRMLLDHKRNMKGLPVNRQATLLLRRGLPGSGVVARGDALVCEASRLPGLR